MIQQNKHLHDPVLVGHLDRAAVLEEGEDLALELGRRTAHALSGMGREGEAGRHEDDWRMLTTDITKPPHTSVFIVFHRSWKARSPK